MTSQPDMQGLDPKALEAAIGAARSAERWATDQLEHRDWKPNRMNIEGLRNHLRWVVDAAAAALASLPQQTAEPVAWRYRHVEYVNWSYIEGPWPETWGTKSWERQPLYAHPASPPVGGAVKELEWHKHQRDDLERYSADPPLASYIITWTASGYELYIGFWGSAGEPRPPFFITADAAKAAAQADYEQRILSALASSERSGREAAEAALQSLHGAWIQFINCWADPFDDPKAEAEEERRNVKALGAAFDECWELGLFGDAIRNLAGTKTNG